MRSTLCTWGGNQKCCRVHFCPLVPAWATTIHKFQGFEAGKGVSDKIKTLIINPADYLIENLMPGLLYVAVSRAKTIGTMTIINPHPRDSAIYFQGSDWGEFRVLFCGTKKNNKKKDGSRIKGENALKRDKWVEFLRQKAISTKQIRFTENAVSAMEHAINHALTEDIFHGKDLKSMIVNMLTDPNGSWKLRREKYLIPQSFFEK